VAAAVMAAAWAAVAGRGEPPNTADPAATPSTHVPAGQPRPLTGVPLRGRTDLSLAVAAQPPFVLDVDSAAVADIRGLAAGKAGIFSVVAVGGRGAAISGSATNARIYGLSAQDPSAVDLGLGRNAAPAGTRDAVWIVARAGRRCTLRGVTLRGRTTLPRRAFRCVATIDGGRAGIVVNRTVLYNPETGKIVLRAPRGVLALAGMTMVLVVPGKGFALLDSRTRRQTQVPWPSKLASLDAPAVDPRGRYVALAFADPSWLSSAKQVLDVWLLDMHTRKLAHVPGMPAFVELKRTSMSWTDDGRLFLLARSMGRDMVAVWRPGQRQFAIKTVRLPTRKRGSDSFATLGCC
jgi:hypothetical protein